MGSQRTFASMARSAKGKITRREHFLAEMDAVIPWPRLLRLIEPHYPKAGNGRQPLGLEKMLRIYFLQQWFNLSDPQAEDADLRQRVDAALCAGGVGRRRRAG
jgi:IS5 family transposase